MKWLKLSGISAICLMGMILLRDVLLHTHTIQLIYIISFLGFYSGFLFLGKKLKSKFFVRVSWAALIYYFLLILTFFLIQMPNDFIRKIFWWSVILLISSWYVSPVFYILFGIFLMKNKQISFARVAGVFSLLVGLFAAGLFIVNPSFLDIPSCLGPTLYAGAFKFDYNLVPLWIADFCFFAFLAAASVMFFKLSKKFE